MSIPEDALFSLPDYTQIKRLGQGNFGVARLYKHNATGDRVAAKFLERGEKIDENVMREILNHKQLQHTHIVQFRGVLLTETHLVILMEYADGGELFQRVCDAGNFTESEARFYFQQLVSGVRYCHRQRVFHRDLKLENALISEGADKRRPSLKICDFGYSKSTAYNSAPHTTVGTPAYIAPEVLSRKEYDGEKADVWSCGVTLYVMLVGAYPFEDPNDPSNFRESIKRIMGVLYSFPSDLRLSTAVKDLLNRIFQKDPRKRCSIDDLYQHPWFRKDLPRDLESPDSHTLPFTPPQSDDEIRAIVKEAQTRPLDPLRQASLDDGIDPSEFDYESSQDISDQLDSVRLYSDPSVL